MKKTLQLLKDRTWSDSSILVPFGLLLAFSPDDAPTAHWRKSREPGVCHSSVSKTACAHPERCAFSGCKCDDHLPPTAA